MVRLSDLVQPKPSTQSAASPESPSLVSAARAKSAAQSGGALGAGAEMDSQALYQTLLAESARCLEEVHQEQRIRLADIPALMELALDRVAADDAELFKSCTRRQEQFSLAAHGVHVSLLSMRVGVELKLRRPSLIDLGIAALLHDIGMMKIRHLLHAPHPLNPEQIEEVKEHPLWGERMARRASELPPNARQAIAQEHERLDGSGYPHSLSGGDIQQDAQLIGLADVYEALTHDRPYRQRLIPAEACRVVTQQHKQAFSMPVLRAFLHGIPIFPQGSWVRLSSGDLAEVVSTNRRHPLTPSVAIRYDHLRQPYPNVRLLDLAQDAAFSIVEGIPEPTTTP